MICAKMLYNNYQAQVRMNDNHHNYFKYKYSEDSTDP